MDVEQGRIAHSVPGRIRIKLAPHVLTDITAPRLRLALLTVPEIDEVQTTPRTGSVVILYDAAAITLRRLLTRLRDDGILDIDPTLDPYAGQTKPMSETARGIHRAFHGVDMQLSQITGGRWDLRSVVPFALGALALRQLVANPAAIGAAPWYVFAWYAFDSFWKLNQGQAVEEDGDIEESEA